MSVGDSCEVERKVYSGMSPETRKCFMTRGSEPILRPFYNWIRERLCYDLGYA